MFSILLSLHETLQLSRERSFKRIIKDNENDKEVTAKTPVSWEGYEYGITFYLNEDR